MVVAYLPHAWAGAVAFMRPSSQVVLTVIAKKLSETLGVNHDCLVLVSLGYTSPLTSLFGKDRKG